MEAARQARRQDRLVYASVIVAAMLLVILSITLLRAMAD
jgi:hypothetical protein